MLLYIKYGNTFSDTCRESKSSKFIRSILDRASFCLMPVQNKQLNWMETI